MSLINIAKVIRTAIMAKDVRENIAKGFEEANSSINEVDGKIGNKDSELNNWMKARERDIAEKEQEHKNLISQHEQEQDEWMKARERDIAEKEQEHKTLISQHEKEHVDLIYDNTLVYLSTKTFTSSDGTSEPGKAFVSNEMEVDCDAIEVTNNSVTNCKVMRDVYNVLGTVGPNQTKRIILKDIPQYHVEINTIVPGETSVDPTKIKIKKYISVNKASNSDWKKTPILACVYNMSIPADQGSNYATFENGYHDISGYAISGGKVKLKKNCYYKISIQLDFTMKSSTIDTTTTSMFLAVLNKDGNRVNYIRMYDLNRYNSSEMSGVISFDYIFDTTGIDSDDVALELNVITNSQQVQSFSQAKLTLIRLAEA